MEEKIMEGRGRSLGNVGNLFPAIFIPRNGDDRLVLTSRFGPILIGNKDGNARLISKLARSFESFLRDVRGK